jgi:hypothetical protein
MPDIDEIRRVGKILYRNDEDWVESCTALVEDQYGRLEILHWTEVQANASHPAERAVAAEKGARLGVGQTDGTKRDSVLGQCPCLICLKKRGGDGPFSAKIG